MKLIKTILLLLIIIFITSCYNYLEVNEIALVEGLTIDYKNNEYNVITEIIDVSSDNENSYLIKSKSKSLDEALKNIKETSSKELSMSHLETVIISKDVLYSNINDIIDYFINQKDITTNFYIVYCNNPEIIINNKNNNFKINTKTITDILDKDKNNKYRFDYIVSSIKSNRSFYIPYVTIDDNNIKIDKEQIIYEK